MDYFLPKIYRRGISGMETQSIRNESPSGRKTMRIAVFGDIHGNIDALTAAYHEATDGKVDAMYHFGDLGGYASFVTSGSRDRNLPRLQRWIVTGM
jgi:hypothetical protein